MSDYLEAITCGECGCVFGLQPRHLASMRKEGGSFYCPNGHSRTFQETESDRLRAELEKKNKQLELANVRETEARDRVDATERKLSATRGVVTRIKNRVGKGVCPCCNRGFHNLRRHMKTKHPDYSTEDVA